VHESNQPLRDYEGCPRPELQHCLDRAERMFDTMGELGTHTLLLCSNVSQTAACDVEMLTSDLQLLVDRAKRRGMRIGYEALSWGTHIRTSSDAWHLVNLVSDSHLGLVLDTFHSFGMNEDLSTLLTIPPERIFLIQVADAPRIAMDIMQLSRRFRCFPGSGDFDLMSFLLPLFARGYDGALSLEIFSDIYPTMSPLLVASYGFASLSNLETAARRSALLDDVLKPSKASLAFA
jgi:4-hydroxyphenylpyruvate dioxygenase